MAATIHSLFPQVMPDIEAFTVYPCYAEFDAPLIAGKYIFSKQTTPPVDFGKLLQGQVGIIAGMMISANCAPADFTQAVDRPLKLRVIHGANKTIVNQAPFPFTEFSQGDNFQLIWKITGATVQQEENFMLEVVGEVDQLSNMTNNELKLKVTFNFFRVSEEALNEKGFTEFRVNKGGEILDTYVVRKK